jgi:hypothetical protein
MTGRRGVLVALALTCVGLVGCAAEPEPVAQPDPEVVACMAWDHWADTVLYSDATADEKSATAGSIAASAPEPLATAMNILVVTSELGTVKPEDVMRVDEHCASVGVTISYPTAS